MLDMLAKMKLEEETENPAQAENSTTAHTSNLHQQSPTIAKRKFQKTLNSTHQVSQISNDTTNPRSTNITMVNLEGKVNHRQ
jgi:hypothetical protein